MNKIIKKLSLVFALILLIVVASSCNNDSGKDPQANPTSTAATTVDTSPSDTKGTAAPTEPEEIDYKNYFNKENMPRLDGSTANIPMANLMLQNLLKISEDEADAMINFSTTPNAYYNLLYESTDLLLVYEADESVKKSIENSNVELEFHPIGWDALVFLANEGNPVESLSTQQIKDIYQGKINNWKDIGGNDSEIVAYQRSRDSGSQALMVKLVMKDLEFAEAPFELAPGSMGGLIEALADYDNSKNALGYSVYYYVKNMYNLPGLRFMKVDGVSPNNETISDGSYPFVNNFYAVIRKNEAQNSDTRLLLNWVLSAEGKKVITDAGYVGIS